MYCSFCVSSYTTYNIITTLLAVDDKSNGTTENPTHTKSHKNKDIT